jgi:hypothetical protein
MFCALATLIRTNMTRKWLPDWCMTASGKDLQALILLTVLFKPEGLAEFRKPAELTAT